MKSYLNVCGEGGEYESLVLDAPIFKWWIVIDDYEVKEVTKDDYAPVAYIIIWKMHLEDKEIENVNVS